MARRGPITNWRVVLRDARGLSTGTDFKELVRFLARRAAEEDFESESLLMRQRRKKMKDLRNTNDKDSPSP